MKIKEIRKTARTALKGKWWLSTAIYLCFLLTLNLSDFVLSLMGLSPNTFLYQPWLWSIFPHYVAIISIVTIGYYILITIPISTGVTWFYLAVLDRESVKFNFLFSAFKNYGKVIGAMIIMFILVFLWSLLLVIPGFIKAISYSQTLFIIKDNPEIKIKDAINESKALMRGFKWKYFLVDLFFIGYGTLISIGIIVLMILLFVLIGAHVLLTELLAFIVIFLALILFSLYFYPYYCTTHAGFYRQLRTISEK